MGLLRWIFESLPSITALVLATLGLSLILLPKELKVLERPKLKWLRWGLAILFLAVGVTAFISDMVQKSAEKTERQKLEHDVNKLTDEIALIRKKQSENHIEAPHADDIETPSVRVDHESVQFWPGILRSAYARVNVSTGDGPAACFRELPKLARCMETS